MAKSSNYQSNSHTNLQRARIYVYLYYQLDDLPTN